MKFSLTGNMVTNVGNVSSEDLLALFPCGGTLLGKERHLISALDSKCQNARSTHGFHFKDRALLSTNGKTRSNDYGWILYPLESGALGLLFLQGV